MNFISGKRRKVTKIKNTGMVATILLFVFVSSALAEMRSINGDKVNLRSGPGERYQVKCEYGKGFPVKILARKGKWAKVQDFENDSGWIYSSLLDTAPYIIVTANKGKNKRINIRSGPGVNYDVVAQAYYGVVIAKEKQEQGWVKVRHESGVVGWIKQSLVWGF